MKSYAELDFLLDGEISLYDCITGEEVGPKDTPDHLVIDGESYVLRYWIKRTSEQRGNRESGNAADRLKKMSEYLFQVDKDSDVLQDKGRECFVLTDSPHIHRNLTHNIIVELKNNRGWRVSHSVAFIADHTGSKADTVYRWYSGAREPEPYYRNLLQILAEDIGLE